MTAGSRYYINRITVEFKCERILDANKYVADINRITVEFKLILYSTDQKSDLILIESQWNLNI